MIFQKGLTEEKIFAEHRNDPYTKLFTMASMNLNNPSSDAAVDPSLVLWMSLCVYMHLSFLSTLDLFWKLSSDFYCTLTEASWLEDFCISFSFIRRFDLNTRSLCTI